MEEIAELSPTSDSQADGPEEPAPAAAGQFPGQFSELITSLRQRLSRTAATLTATQAVSVPVAAKPVPRAMMPVETPVPAPSPAAAAPGPSAAGRPGPIPAAMTIAGSTAKGHPTPPPPRPTASSSGRAAANVITGPAVADVGSASSSGSAAVAKYQTGAHPAKSLSVLPFKRRRHVGRKKGTRSEKPKREASP